MDKFSWVSLVIFVLLGSKVSLKICVELETKHEHEEICNLEKFEPTCDNDEVIMITDAKYGRMKLGRCIGHDIGYLGCSADVMDIIDKRCSGRPACEVYIPNQEIASTRHCPSYLTRYLDVSYSCVKVETPACQTCPNTSLAQVTSHQGYISGVAMTEEGGNCGSVRCPFFIEVAPGQNINVTLFDFDRLEHNSPDTCFVLAVVTERAIGRSTTVCSGNYRERHVYTSFSNTLEVHLVTKEAVDNRGQFLLYFEATGCPFSGDLDNMWIEQNNHTHLIAKCNRTGETWLLICEGTKWIGLLGTCPPEPTEEPKEPTNPDARDIYSKLSDINDCLKEALKMMTIGPFEQRVKNLITDYFITKARDSTYRLMMPNPASPTLKMYLTSCNHLSNEIKFIEEIKARLKDEDLSTNKENMAQTSGIDLHILDIIIYMEKFVSQAKPSEEYEFDTINATVKWKDVLGFLDPAAKRSESFEFHVNQTVLYQLGECVQMAVML